MAKQELIGKLTKGVFRITLNRPEVRNALAPKQRDQIIEWLGNASAHEKTRCVVITGAGGAFCSGADLRGSSSTGERRVGDVARTIADGAQRLIAAVMDCEKPVIAAVDGVAAGLGAHLALACDLVIASDTARFIEVFVRRGLVPDAGGAYLLVRLIGPHKAKELAFFGGDVHAPDALEMGLINCVVPADQLDETVDRWANQLAAGPTRTIALTKKLINDAHDLDRATAFLQEAWAQEQNMATDDAAEGLRAFAERRDPEFKGW